MWKAALAGTAVLAIVGSSLVYAQQRERPGGFDSFRPNLEDMRAFAEARLAALHAGLGLTADQEKNWPAFEQASREMAKLRLDRVSAAVQERRDRAPQSADPSARMHRRAAAKTESGAALQKVADALDPLYKSLDDGQKRRFAMLQQFVAPRGDGLGGREFRWRDGGGPRRFEFGPRRTDYAPQVGEGGEERL
ncbi:MAG TPA: Spy/CpxP family protein refolding chaperone [Xanthobacteraceae bacterium]